jgi:hypothetical protein
VLNTEGTPASHSRRNAINGENTKDRRDVNKNKKPNVGGKPASAGKRAIVGTPWTAVHRKLQSQQQQKIHQEQKAS